MNIAFYHYVWPHYFKEKDEDFRQKISEYLVIYQLAKALEENGNKIIRYAKQSDNKYLPEKNIILFHSGIKQLIDLIKFFFTPPDVFCLVSKSIFHSSKLVPIIRLICQIRKVKFIIFMGHDESNTSTKVLKDVKPYKYQEENYWDNPEELKNRLRRNELYRPKSHNEYICIPAKIIKSNLTNEGWPENQIILLPYGIDSNHFIPNQNKKSNNDFKILYAGNGATRKGLPYLLKAFENLSKEHKNIKLTILSHSIKNIQIENVNQLEDINDDQLLNLYQTHDVFVMPSLLDGWGLTVMEAMSCGLPVIVTPLTGIADIIENRKNGVLVPPKNDKEIYNFIKLLMNNSDLRKAIGDQARNTIKNFSWKEISDQFLKII